VTAATSNGITIEYETTGHPADPTLLMIMGLGAQLIAWDVELVDAFAARGFHVLRFDNRDIGLSSWLDDLGSPDILGLFSGESRPMYAIADMADDAAGLLEALGIAAAHVLGVSMGGMIAQSLAIRHRDRVRTLTSVMATTGDPSVGQAHPEAVRKGRPDNSRQSWGSQTARPSCRR
jgi:pimeloyl-ACP methyl ester carboxylesterase